jgi:hypothetical protein
MEQLSRFAHGGGRLAKLNAEQEAVLATLVEEDNDAILVELCDRLEQRVSVRCLSSDDGTHCPKTQAHARKKNFARSLCETQSESSSCECSIGKKLEQ